MQSVRKYIYTYNEIHNLLFNLVPKINKYKPDIIIAIAGGGLIPARILRTFLNLPLYIISVKHYYNDLNNCDKRYENINVVQWCKQDFTNKKILLVDEVDDTRKTLDFCTKKLKKDNNPKSIAVCVIHNKKKEKIGKFHNDIKYFSALEVGDEWIEYPWDYKISYETN